MNMPGRKYSAGSGYRYGFNGKENDKDISEGGQDYGARVYDNRLAKFLSVDPLTNKYAYYTPYQFAGNMPIEAIDLDGCEPGPSGPGPARGVAPLGPRSPAARPNEEAGFEEWREAGYSDPASYQQARAAAGRRLIYEEKEKEERAEESRALRDPIFRRFYNTLQTWARNSFEVAPSVFGESPTTVYKQIHINRGNGNAFEYAWGQALAKNPNVQAVAKQVTLVVEGTMKDGTVMTAKIRVDFIAIKDNGLSLDLYEAKYSFQEIKVGGVVKTLTENQGRLNNILQLDNTLSVFVRGDKLKEYGLPSGTNIITYIKSAQVIVPEGSASTGKNQAASTPPKTATSTNKPIKKKSG